MEQTSNEVPAICNATVGTGSVCNQTYQSRQPSVLMAMILDSTASVIGNLPAENFIPGNERGTWSRSMPSNGLSPLHESCEQYVPP